MSIFDSKAGIYVEVDEKEYPPDYRVFLERLNALMKKAEVVKDLVYEEMLNKEYQHNSRMAKKYKEEADEERKLKEEEIRLKEEAIFKANGEQRQKINAILNLQKEGLSVSKIASVFGISEEEVSKYLF